MIHAKAEVESGAVIGADTRVWRFAHVRQGAIVGSNCTLGQAVFIDSGARIGDNVKLQNHVSVYAGVTLEDGVFVGPHATFTNDKYPRAVSPAGTPLTASQWQVESTLIRSGASIGASATILAGTTVGSWAMVGAGSVVTQDVPDHGLVRGVPARLVGYACKCGRPLSQDGADDRWRCSNCGESLRLPPLPRARV